MSLDSGLQMTFERRRKDLLAKKKLLPALEGSQILTAEDKRYFTQGISGLVKDSIDSLIDSLID